MTNYEKFYISPNHLAPDYSRFDVANRILLTGHSHQAWPDAGFEGQKQAWLDAAQNIDDKWENAFAKADQVRQGFADLIGDKPDNIALDVNTHALVIRFLSALPLRQRPKLITTKGEFHSIRRQTDRLVEENIEVIKIPSDAAEDIVERMIENLDDKTAAVLISSVLFRSAKIVTGLGELMKACQSYGVELLVDAYHALNVLPFSLQAEGLEDAFIVGGGYKYCQLGEGNCFMRIPPGRSFRPIITGWFAEFGDLESAEQTGKVSYGPGHWQFGGATYDPTSHYRAVAVFEFFRDQELTPHVLREVNQHQVGLLAERFDAKDFDSEKISRDTTIDLKKIGGFLTLQTPHAAEIVLQLRQENVMADYRDMNLRLGPGPYLSDDQLIAGIDALANSVKKL